MKIATGETWKILEKDRVVCHLALKEMKKALKTAGKAVHAVNIDVPAVKFLTEQVDGLLALFKDWREEENMGIPFEWAGALRTGLAIEYDQVARLIDKKEKMHIDTTAESTRQKQLGRIMGELDVAGMGAPVPAMSQAKAAIA